MNYIYVVIGCDKGEEIEIKLVTTDKQKAKEELKYRNSNVGAYYRLEVWLNGKELDWCNRGEYDSFIKGDN